MATSKNANQKNAIKKRDLSLSHLLTNFNFVKTINRYMTMLAMIILLIFTIGVLLY